MGEDDPKKTVCEHHADMASDVKDIKAMVSDIKERLITGDGKFDLFELRIQGCEKAVDSHITEHKNYTSKILIGLVLSGIVAAFSLAYSNRDSDRGGSYHAPQGEKK